MTPRPDAKFEFRAMDQTERDLALYAECFARNDNARDLASLRWIHAENPTGRNLVDLAIANTGRDERLAGIYAVMPIWARVADKRVLACQSLDTLTDADFRGQGLFLKMARSTYARAQDAGFSFVYGFPNGNSAHGFFSRLGWAVLDPVPFLVRPLRTGLVTRRLSPRLAWLPDVGLPAPMPGLSNDQDLRTVSRFGVAHEEVWNAFSAGVGVTVERDARYLNWRLRDKPVDGYRVVALTERDRLLGFVAYVAVDKHGGRVGYVLELLHLPDRPDAGSILARAAVNALAAQGADLVLAWSLPHSPNRAPYSRAGFIEFPERHRPVELHIGARSFEADTATLVATRSAWYLSYLDSDTV